MSSLAKSTEAIEPNQSQRFDLSGVESDAKLLELFMKMKRDSSLEVQKKYSSSVSSLLAFLQELDKGLRRLDIDTLQNFIAHIQESKKPKAAYDTLVIVRAFLNWAHDTGYIKYNVASMLRLKAWEDTRSRRVLTEDEVQRIVSAAEGIMRVMVLVLYGSAMRISELCALRWRNIYWHSDISAVTLESPKGGKTRTISIPTAFLESIKTLESWNNGNPDRDDLIFTYDGGKPLSRFIAAKMLKKAVIAAGLPKEVSPHWLRHSHGTHAIARGANLSQVQQTMGHSDPKTTTIYVHMNPVESTGSFLPIIKQGEYEK